MQEEFFSVIHSTSVNVIPMPADFHLPTLEALDAELPEPFRIASAAIDRVNNRLLRSQSESMHDLEIIHPLSRKSALIRGNLQAVQDHPEHGAHQGLGYARDRALLVSTSLRGQEHRAQERQL